MEHTEYNGELFAVDLYSKFISTDFAYTLKYKILNEPRHFHHSTLTKKGVPSKKRNKTIYGSIPKYTYTYRGKIVESTIYDWSLFPELQTLSNMISNLVGQPFSTCVIQIYNSGIVEIKPHRDKEMKPGSIIASISLGETRIMRFEKSGFKTIDIPLESASLCCIRPPTNDTWLHSIPPDSSTGVRISLVFRNF